MKLSELFGREDLKDKFVLQKFLCTFLSCSREELWLDMDKELSDEIIQKVLVAYKSYVEDKKPIEYILGHVDFFGTEFFVDEATLIPRPETEYMITAATEYIQQTQDTRYKIQASSSNHVSWVMHHESNLLLDIWTGCGVLWISVLLQNPNYFSHVIFSDYFANALEIAKRNYKKLITGFSWKVDFFQSDLLDFLVRWTSELPDGNTVLVANLPYIPEETFEQNVADNVKKREPKPAFVGWDDGLDYYRIMLDQILQLRGTREQVQGKTGSITCFLEMMTRQVDILRQLYDDTFVFEEVKTFHFNIRIVKAYLK